MITKITNKNQFNSESWEVKMSSLLHIFIHKTNSDSFLFEFKEWKFLNYKTHFSYTSNDFIECAINDFYDELHKFLEKIGKWDIDFVKYEGLKFKTISYFIEDDNELAGNVFSASEQLAIKALNYYQEEDFENAYKVLRGNYELVKQNVDANLLLIDVLIKLSNPQKNDHYKFYRHLDDCLLELFTEIKERKVVLSEKQQTKFSQMKMAFMKIPFPEELISNEPFGIKPEQNIEISLEDKFLFDAMECIKNNDLNQAYIILLKAESLFKVNLNGLFLLAKLSMILKKDENVPRHIIALISEKECGRFTGEQEKEFTNMIINYRKNYL